MLGHTLASRGGKLLQRSATFRGHGARRAKHSARRSRVAQVLAGKGFGFSLQPKTKDLSNGRVLLSPRPITPMLTVPAHIQRPPYADSGVLPEMSSRPEIHDAQGVQKMRASGALAARVLQRAGQLVAPGVTTDELDRAVHAMIVEAGAYPSPLNYGRFPKSVCTSVNECICHGIPDDRPLLDGDIINIDVTVYLDGYHGDCSAMFYVGSGVSAKARRLCEATREARDAAVQLCGPGVPFTAIGAAIADVASKYKLNIVRDFIGHGVGRVFHAAPYVLHYRNSEATGVMRPNQTFTIEPIFAEGSPKVRYWKDEWTAVTTDGGLAAQWEHTVLITANGAEVLTQLPAA